MKCLDCKVDVLDIKKDIIKLLNDNNIFYVRYLYILNRKNLKSFGLNDRDIYQVIIQLELLGLDLNGKKY